MQAASRKKRRKENHATAGIGGWIGQGCKADKQKDPFVFISVTFGCLAITLLHSKQRALPAEGKAKIKKSCDGKSKCLYSLTLLTVGSEDKVHVGKAKI